MNKAYKIINLGKFEKFYQIFIKILSGSRDDFTSLFNNKVENSKIDNESARFKDVLYYLGFSLSIGFAIAGIAKLVDRPNAFELDYALYVIISWILYAILIHGLIKIVKGKGKFVDTVFVTLYIMATLHVIAIPAASALSVLFSEDKIINSYKNVVLDPHAIASLESRFGQKIEILDLYNIEFDVEWETTVINLKEEYSVNDYQNLVGTCLPGYSIQLLADNIVVQDKLELIKNDRRPIEPSYCTTQRVSEIKQDYEIGALIFVSLYILIILTYLVRGLSVVHEISYLRTSYAVLGLPFLIILTLSLLTVLAIYLLVAR